VRPETDENGLAALERALGHRFEDRGLLETALTHRSYAHERGAEASASYERLEFLGDAFLGLVVSDWLLRDDPEAPEGVQVFVDWVETMQVSQTGPTTYRVDVIARSLSSGDGEAFTRRPSMVVTVDVEVTDDGLPRVIGLPVISDVMTAPQADVAIVDLPADLAGRVGPDTGRVVGGLQRADGSWAVVVMGKGADGVARPTLVYP